MEKDNWMPNDCFSLIREVLEGEGKWVDRFRGGDSQEGAEF